MKPAIRELIKRYPKVRGYRNRAEVLPLVTVSLSVLEKRFRPGDIITPQILLEKRIIRKIKGRMPQVKILGTGEIKKTLTIKGCLLSKQAKAKVEKAGGKITT
jgi:large subunit ribosomal protein L15